MGTILYHVSAAGAFGRLRFCFCLEVAAFICSLPDSSYETNITRNFYIPILVGLKSAERVRLQGMKSADAAAKGGPSVAGKPAAAVHPSILPNPQKPSPLLGAIGT